MTVLVNDNPRVYEVQQSSAERPEDSEVDENVADPFDAQEIYDLVSNINDPEHPLTLGQLNVVQPDHIEVSMRPIPKVVVEFSPTIPHCSMATLIGLCIRVRLLRCLPPRFKVSVVVRHGTHQSEDAVNKQLNDKERVAAALENNGLLQVVNQLVLSRLA